MRRQPFVEKAELKVAVVDRHRLRIVRILGLAAQLERRAGTKSGDDVLSPFKGNTGNLGVKPPRVADRRIRIAQILVALGKALRTRAIMASSFESKSPF